MKKLNGLWKEIGSCGKEKEDALWKEFRCAADDYFAGLKQFNEQILSVLLIERTG